MDDSLIKKVMAESKISPSKSFTQNLMSKIEAEKAIKKKLKISALFSAAAIIAAIWAAVFLTLPEISFIYDSFLITIPSILPSIFSMAIILLTLHLFNDTYTNITKRELKNR
ncbi:hypothetical protein QA597_04540 [Marinilabiliaceae bacterium ANBcel2]|nr:hypothetical protein [Marinilabiliaceae bacterium ANBcel2]